MFKLKISIFLGLIIIGCGHKNIYYDPEKSHHTEQGFTNPYLELDRKGKSLSDRFKFFKMIFEKRPNPDENDQAGRLEFSVLDSLINNSKRFALWIGHSTVLIHIDGKFILTDPIFSERCSPLSFFGPKRYSKTAIPIDRLPLIDVVLISHNHYDHLDFETVRLLGDDTRWVVPLGLKEWFINHGISNVNEYDWWEDATFEDIKLSCLPSQHWSKRSMLRSFDTLWASWAIEINGFKFWFAGDTGYNEVQFKEIGNLKGPFDFSAIPIGAYEPRWFMKNFHVNPEESVLIHRDVKSSKSIGIHWGTFILTTEPINEPPIKLKKALVNNYIDSTAFITTEIGEIIIFD